VKLISESADWIAFFPDEPATPGHTLVVPRSHARDLWSIEPEVGARLMVAVIRIGRAIRTALSPQGMNLISSSGVVAEQTIFHAHLHVVPRWEGDRIDDIWPTRRPTDTHVADDVADRIRMALENNPVQEAS